MTDKTCFCDVYKSSRLPEYYIYVDRKDGLQKVPEELMDRFGEPELALSFTLTPDRKLAREKAARVLESILNRGYHLQMPEIKSSQNDKD